MPPSSCIRDNQKGIGASASIRSPTAVYEAMRPAGGARQTPCDFGRINRELLHAAPSQTRPLSTPAYPRWEHCISGAHLSTTWTLPTVKHDAGCSPLNALLQCLVCHAITLTADSFMAPSPLSPDPSAPAANTPVAKRPSPSDGTAFSDNVNCNPPEVNY
ncbi:hypothetical protein CPLU01_03510 [Colletotrichum plurivorum]|uniref:Uncharacterized protein n=1 Tax=Colletotrichum plurivorum TaxID=2175906 RepID=A0A8H6NLD8_9PEZI|nr:hypothetical protein CPLU01_03510 [Colletotrichum plurivorum]